MTISLTTRIFNSKIISRYFTSLLGVGFDSKREIALVNILVISTVLLSIASGYTTYTGLGQYVPGFISILITISIQGLLFTASWRIGASLSVSTFKISLMIIYILTFFASVFFSYGALLDFIYKPVDREKDENERARYALVHNIGNRISHELDAEYKNKTNISRMVVKEFKARVDLTISENFKDIKEAYNENLHEYQKLVDKYNREVSHGGTVIPNKGTRTPPGVGPYADKYKTEYVTFYKDNLLPYKKTISKIDETINKFDVSYNDLIEVGHSFTTNKLNTFNKAYDGLLALLRDHGIEKVNDIPSEVIENISTIQRISDYKEWQQSIVYSREPLNLEELKLTYTSLINKIPLNNLDLKSELLDIVENIGIYEGGDVHYFILSIGELLNLNLLAIGALIIALLIDILILFCGLLGARPESFLDMNKSEDLYDVKELALETIFSLNLDSENINNIDDAFTRRIIQILNHCEPCLKYAEKGYAAIIAFDDVRNINMSKEIGVLLSLGMAHDLPDGNIGFKTKFILWLADQVTKSREKESTQFDISESLKKTNRESFNE